MYDDGFHAEAAPRVTKTVLVCEALVPFVQGGAELLVRGLLAELTRRGYRTEKVSIPFKWHPKEELLSQAATWRLIDLSEANGVHGDRHQVPTCFVRHPNDVTLLLHQYRAIDDLCGTPYSDLEDTARDVANDPRAAQSLGDAGDDRARSIIWDMSSINPWRMAPMVDG